MPTHPTGPTDPAIFDDLWYLLSQLCLVSSILCNLITTDLRLDGELGTVCYGRADVHVSRKDLHIRELVKFTVKIRRWICHLYPA